MVNPISCVIPEITIHNDRVETTSRAVANFFQKEHKDVLRKIAMLECTPLFTQRNFTLCHENNELQNGKPQPYYSMTRNGFIFLVMGFTGKRAAAFKEAYIAEFDRMESELIAQHSSSLPNMPIFPTDTDFSYLTIVKAGRVTGINIARPGQILMDYDDFVRLAKRNGCIVIPQVHLRSLSSDEIIEICEAARIVEAKYNAA
ncbi:Rha family transcriptional regulator [Enterobacter asburiae]|uniref:Rha family transcriptional regulator n=1 Tax=Enterobacter asburiae TaxID=61645 RepID=UPI003BD963AB